MKPSLGRLDVPTMCDGCQSSVLSVGCTFAKVHRHESAEQPTAPLALDVVFELLNNELLVANYAFDKISNRDHANH